MVADNSYKAKIARKQATLLSLFHRTYPERLEQGLRGTSPSSTIIKRTLGQLPYVIQQGDRPVRTEPCC